jgi:hypothetical protein
MVKEYWYENRDQLSPEQVFLTRLGGIVKLDRRVPGDGTKWYVADWCGGWVYEDGTIEPGELAGKPVADNPSAVAAAIASAIGEAG